MTRASVTVTQEDRSIPLFLMWSFWLMWLTFLIQPAVLILHLRTTPLKIIHISSYLLFVSGYLLLTYSEAARLTQHRPVPFMQIEREGRWWSVLVAMILLGSMMSLARGSWALGSFIFISAAALSRLTIRQAVLLIAILMTLSGAIGIFTHAPLDSVVLTTVLIPIVGSTTRVFTSAIITNRELRLARQEITRLAVSEERLRFARDLHDLLGHTLSLIALKSELAGKLVTESPEKAEHEIGDIETAARTALREVREAVAGYRQMTLADELLRAQELLTSAGIICTIDNRAGDITPEHAAVLAWVVREGITNVIRHSRARQCCLTLMTSKTSLTLTVCNDGTAGALLINGEGNGLRGMRERIEAASGTCIAGLADDHSFKVRVDLPLDHTRTSPSAGALLANLKGSHS